MKLVESNFCVSLVEDEFVDTVEVKGVGRLVQSETDVFISYYMWSVLDGDPLSPSGNGILPIGGRKSMDGVHPILRLFSPSYFHFAQDLCCFAEVQVLHLQ